MIGVQPTGLHGLAADVQHRASFREEEDGAAGGGGQVGDLQIAVGVLVTTVTGGDAIGQVAFLDAGLLGGLVDHPLGSALQVGTRRRHVMGDDLGVFIEH